LKLEGVYSVLPTPFTAAGDLDLESLKRVIDLFIGAGVNGLTALGVTSEVARMNDGERHCHGRHDRETAGVRRRPVGRGG
jgi:4-hydroxy-tetrahydrodipicolinate synthase